MKSGLSEEQDADLEKIRKLSCYVKGTEEFKKKFTKVALIASKKLCQIRLVKFSFLMRR